MTKKDLVRNVHAAHGGLSYDEAQRIIETMLKTIKKRLAQGEKVMLTGFGVFRVNQRQARQIRDLKTSRIIEIRPFKYLSFRAAKHVQVTSHDQEGPEEAVLQNRRSMQAGGR